MKVIEFDQLPSGTKEQIMNIFMEIMTHRHGGDENRLAQWDVLVEKAVETLSKAGVNIP